MKQEICRDYWQPRVSMRGGGYRYGPDESLGSYRGAMRPEAIAEDPEDGIRPARSR
jgi:hypothetical protein